MVTGRGYVAVRSGAWVGALGACLLAAMLGAQEVVPGTAFTYQGQLLFEGAPVNEACDLRFSLWDHAEGGLQVGPSVDVAGLAVVGGMFTVTLDFGAVFDGRRLWLEVTVARPAGSPAWAVLAPRQALLAVPYALGALSVPWAGLTGRPSLLGSLDGVSSDQGDIDLVAGPNVTIVSDNTAKTITIGTLASGDITGVSAGAGLAGGGDSGAVALSLAAGYLDGSALDARFVNEGQAGAVSGAMLAAGSVALPALASGVLAWGNLGGIPAGFADGVDHNTQYAAGTGLILLGTTFAVDFAEVAGAVHTHAGSQIASGTVSEARIDAALHRDGEVKDLHWVGNAAGTTVLDEASSPADSGAALIGVFDEFRYSSATSLQGVLRDLDTAIVAAGGPQNLFGAVELPDGGTLLPDGVTDVLTVAAGPGIAIVGDPDADSLTVSLAAGGVASEHLAPGVLAWGHLTDVPAGFADGTDNDTTYSAGSGLQLAGAAFRVDFAAVAAAVHVHSGADLTTGTVAEARVAEELARDSEVLALVLAADGPGSGLEADLLDGLDAAAFAAAVHAHSGADLTTGTVAAARIASELTRDSEVLGLVQAGDGSGSGLDADLLDGLHAVSFAAAGHAHAGADIMTGTVAEARIAGDLARDLEVVGLVLAGDGPGSGLDADLLDGLHAAAFAAAAHAHSGADIMTGTVAEARIAGDLTRDLEVVGLVLAGDGPGSGLDADLLDGLHAAAFAAAGHDHDIRYFTETELSSEGGGGVVHWGNLTAVPAGFSDGVDDDTTYAAGAGLELAEGVFGIASAGVTESRLGDGAVTAAKLASGAVASVAIADGTVAEADLAPAVAERLHQGPLAFAFIDGEGGVLAGSGNVGCALADGVYAITLAGASVDGSCVTVLTPSAAGAPVTARYAPTADGRLEVSFREAAAGPLVARDFHFVMFRGAAAPGYGVSGRVTDGLGAGVAGVEIRFASLSSTSAPPMPSVFTDAAGEWSQADLHGRVRVTPFAGPLEFVPTHREVTGEATGVDFAVGERYYRDGDGDGYGDSADWQVLAGPTAPYTATQGGDCNDAADSIYPGAPELCNGLDDDCDQIVDEEVAGVGDACGSAVGACVQGVLTCVGGQLVCVGAVEPSPEVCDGIDNNCDGVVDEGCSTYYQDLDADGYGDAAHSQLLMAPTPPYIVTEAGDCDDADPAIHPGATELCDGRDNDCDGTADEDFDFQNDPAHCGGCGQSCDDGNPDTIDTCVGGECQHLAP